MRASLASLEGNELDIIDYRDKLGIGFNDQEKFELMVTQVFNTLNSLHGFAEHCAMSYMEYYLFCNATGTPINCGLDKDYHECDRYHKCLEILYCNRTNIKQFLYTYVALINSIDPQKERGFSRTGCKNILTNALNDFHIPVQSVETDKHIWFFPQGAEELDKALVSEPLTWLEEYPKARNTYIIALKQYADGIYIRDVADNLRKTLEAFLQEFLENTKNLETNKNEICQYLGSQGVDPGIAGLFQPLINAYKNINDRIAKHNDKVDKRLLEFLLYQTGVLIRMVISVKMSEVGGELDAD